MKGLPIKSFVIKERKREPIEKRASSSVAQLDRNVLCRLNDQRRQRSEFFECQPLTGAAHTNRGNDLSSDVSQGG